MKQAPGRITGRDADPDGEGGEEKPEPDGCPAHGGDRAPGRRCRTAPPSDEKPERGQHDRQVDRGSQELQPLGDAGIAPEQEQVARAIRATGVDRVPEEEPDGVADDPREVRGGNDRALDPRRESAARKGDDEVDRDGDAPRLDEDAQREGQRRVP